MTTLFSTSMTHLSSSPRHSTRRVLGGAATGLALMFTMTACQPEQPAGSATDSIPDLSTPVLSSGVTTQGPFLSQELVLDASVAATATTSTSAAPTTSDLAADLSTTTTTEYGPTTSDVDEEEGLEADSAAEVPGAALDYGPPAGAFLEVVGVAHDDVLNFRVDPDPTSAVVVSVSPFSLEYQVVAVGQAWIAPSGIWWNVTVNGEQAWANQSYLAGQGHGDHFFEDVAEELGVLRFESITDAALAVAGTQASEAPVSRVVLVAAPESYEDSGVATVDVLDLGDDSLKGLRIWIQVEYIYDDSGENIEAVVLVDVYMNPLCGRGTSEDGLCL